MTAPQHRTIDAGAVQRGAVYRFGIDDQETLDYTVNFATAFPTAATSFAINGSVDYGSFTQAVAPVVDSANKLITLYVNGIAAGSSSIILVRGQATIDSTTMVIEVPFILTARDSSGQLTPPVAAVGYYATSAELAAVKAAGTEAVLGSNVSLTQTVPQFVFVAPAACTLTYAAIDVGTSIGASDSVYWSIEIRRYRAGVSALIATKTTQATGGEAFVAGTPWVYDSGTFDSGNKVMQAGDMIAFFCTRVGGVAALVAPQYLLRYTLT